MKTLLLQCNAIRLFARFVGGGAKRRTTFQTTPVLCFAYVSRRTKSERRWSYYEWKNDQISFYVIHLILVEVQTNAGYMPAAHSNLDIN